MESKAHKNKDSPQSCVDSDAVKPEKIKFPLYLHPDTMQQVEMLYRLDNCTSKTEFLEKAVRFYCGYLQSENVADFLAPELVSMLDGIVKGTEQRLSRGLFKVAVELGAITHMLAVIHEIDDDTLRRLRAMCVDEVKRINGVINFEKAVRYQRRDE